MTALAIKLLAVISMTIDHTGSILGNYNMIPVNVYIIMRSIGRIAFPIFAFLIGNGWRHTSNKKKYFSNMLLFAAVSQIPFSISFSSWVDSEWFNSIKVVQLNYSRSPSIILFLALVALASSYYLLNNKKNLKLHLVFVIAAVIPFLQLNFGQITVLGAETNIFYTFVLSMIVISTIDGFLNKEKRERLVLKLGLCLLVLYFYGDNCDYSFNGIALIVGTYLLGRHRMSQLLFLAVWAYLQYAYGMHGSLWNYAYFLGALTALIPIYLYNNKSGAKIKWFFYIYYPAHLLVIGIFIVLFCI